jgi:hypothetical protein
MGAVTLNPSARSDEARRRYRPAWNRMAAGQTRGQGGVQPLPPGWERIPEWSGLRSDRRPSDHETVSNQLIRAQSHSGSHSVSFKPKKVRSGG